MRNFWLFFIVFVFTTFYSCKPDIEGCTDPKGDNYNPEATVSDSSCIYNGVGIGNSTGNGDGDTTTVIFGCTDTVAANYNPTANQDDGSCDYLGCTDPDAENYDPNATIDDGSCIDKREKFVGDWNVVGDCGIFPVSDPQTISYDSTVTDTILFSPFSAFGDAFALVNGFDVTMPNQSIALGPISISFSGAGKLNNNKDALDLTITYDAGFAGSGTCVANYTRQ